MANRTACSEPGSEKITTHRELWGRFVLAAIIVFLLDLLVRRVRLFDRKFLPKRRLRRAFEGWPCPIRRPSSSAIPTPGRGLA